MCPTKDYSAPRDILHDGSLDSRQNFQKMWLSIFQALLAVVVATMPHSSAMAPQLSA